MEDDSDSAELERPYSPEIIRFLKAYEDAARPMRNSIVLGSKKAGSTRPGHVRASMSGHERRSRLRQLHDAARSMDPKDAEDASAVYSEFFSPALASNSRCSTPKALNTIKKSTQTGLPKKPRNIALKSTSKPHKMPFTKELDVHNLNKSGIYPTLFTTQEQLTDHLNTHQYELSYQCTLCHQQFHTASRFRKHAQNYHKTQNLDAKRISYDPKCPLCSKIISRQCNFNQHIRNHFSLAPKIAKFQCLLCKKNFPNWRSAKKHKLEVHKDFQIKDIFAKQNVKKNAKVISKKIKNAAKADKSQNSKDTQPKTPKLVPASSQKNQSDKPEAKQPKANQTKINQTLFIPKTTLFQCTGCKLHILNLNCYRFHLKGCDRATKGWMCKICQRLIRPADRPLHEIQHQHTTEFQVINFSLEVIKTMACKCPECSTYFDFLSFLKHMRQHSSAPVREPSIKCNICNHDIGRTAYLTHMKQHMRNRPIILMDFVKNEDRTQTNATRKPATKRKSVHFEEPEPKKRRLEETERGRENINLYYCSKCRSCIHETDITKQQLNFHLHGKCAESKKLLCSYCGLAVAKKSEKLHMRLHENTQLSVKDYVFTSLQTKRIISAPVPDYPDCKKCHVHTINIGTLKQHDCKDQFKTCKVCDKKFTDLAYKLHVSFHEIGIDLDQSQSTSDRSDLPYLKEVFPHHPETWNILYMCGSCRVTTDSYDCAVKHSQDHLKDMTKRDAILNCNICGLHFESVSFSRHNELHYVHHTITKANFRILDYNYNDLLSEKWFELFKTVDSSEMKSIISRSIYRASREFLMRIVQEGSPESTMYKCKKCIGIVDPEKVRHHYEVICNLWRHYPCAVCKVEFTTEEGLTAHIEFHKKHKEHGPFRIVEFSRPTGVGSGRRGSNKVFYKCRFCDCCYLAGQYLKNHTCDFDSLRRCDHCKWLFTPKNYTDHIALHSDIHAYRFQVRYFEINIQSGKKEVIILDTYNRYGPLFRCDDCLIHFHKAEELKWHLTHGHKSRDETKFCCDCQLNVSEILHPSSWHTAKDLPIIDSAEFNTIWKKKLFRCVACRACFFSSVECKRHAEELGCSTESRPCGRCQLSFTPLANLQHEKLFHELKLMSRSDLVIMEYNMETQETVEITDQERLQSGTSLPSSKVYRCSCGVHFVLKRSLETHMKQGHAASNGIECSECGLLFPNNSVKYHVMIQHQKWKLQRQHLTIEDEGGEQSPCAERSYAGPSGTATAADISEAISSDRDINSMMGNPSRAEFSFHNTQSAIKDVSLAEKSTDLGNKADKPQSEKKVPQASCSTPKEKKTKIRNTKNEGTPQTKKRTTPKKVKEPNLIRLYKCGTCDVHYTKHKPCYKHIKEHKPLHVGEYIECELCQLKFASRAYNNHKKMHDNVFDLQNVIIEEYTPNTEHIEVYYAAKRTVTVSKDTGNIEIQNNSTKGFDERLLNARLTNPPQSPEVTKEITNISAKNVVQRNISNIKPANDNIASPDKKIVIKAFYSVTSAISRDTTVVSEVINASTSHINKDDVTELDVPALAEINQNSKLNNVSLTREDIDISNVIDNIDTIINDLDKPIKKAANLIQPSEEEILLLSGDEDTVVYSRTDDSGVSTNTNEAKNDDTNVTNNAFAFRSAENVESSEVISKPQDIYLQRSIRTNTDVSCIDLDRSNTSIGDIIKTHRSVTKKEIDSQSVYVSTTTSSVTQSNTSIGSYVEVVQKQNVIYNSRKHVNFSENTVHGTRQSNNFSNSMDVTAENNKNVPQKTPMSNKINTTTNCEPFNPSWLNLMMTKFSRSLLPGTNNQNNAEIRNTSGNNAVNFGAVTTPKNQTNLQNCSVGETVERNQGNSMTLDRNASSNRLSNMPSTSRNLYKTDTAHSSTHHDIKYSVGETVKRNSMTLDRDASSNRLSNMPSTSRNSYKTDTAHSSTHDINDAFFKRLEQYRIAGMSSRPFSCRFCGCRFNTLIMKEVHESTANCKTFSMFK